MNRHRVSLVKTRPLACTGKHCRLPLEPYTTPQGWTRYRPTKGRDHTRLCETRAWGRAVALGAAFATCEETDDRHNAPLGGAA